MATSRTSPGRPSSPSTRASSTSTSTGRRAAAAFAEGEFTVEQVREEKLTDPTILDIASKIELVADEEYDELLAQHIDRAHMTVTTTDGKTYEAMADDRTGSSANPLTEDEILEKFYRIAGTKVRRPQLDDLRDAVMDLESVRDCSNLPKFTMP